jgi:hypothetical protein
MDQGDRVKRDMTVIYGNRACAVRTYRHNGGGHGVDIENRTPLHSRLGPATDAPSSFADGAGAVAALVAAVADPIGDFG